VGAEGCDHRDAGGVAPARNQDAADPWLIVPRVEIEPSIAKEGFEALKTIYAGSGGTPMLPR
jgi:hypothetical protein